MKDYITTKIDFYRGDYNDVDYEELYSREIQPACNIISGGQNGDALKSKVEAIKTSISGLTLDWSDSVDGLFRDYMDLCVESLASIESSISDQFIGIAEPAYKRIEELIRNLSTQNTDYQDKFDEKPDSNDFYRDTYFGKDDAGNEIWKKQLDHREYLAAVTKWKEDIGDLAGLCIETIASIEENITELVGVNSSTITVPGTETPLNIAAPVFNFEYPLESDSQTSTERTTNTNTNTNTNINININTLNGGSFGNYVKVTLGGVTFYSLANIKSGRTQEHDQCLSYARANAIAITERNGYNIPIQGGNKNGCVYTSTDPNEIYQIAANEYKNGRSVVLEVKGSEKNNTRHFVAVAGFEEGTDFNNIQPENIFIVDSTVDDSTSNPAGYKQLNTSNGGQKRYLVDDKKLNSPHEFGTNYTVIVYSDVDYSTLPHTDVAPKHQYGASQSSKGDGALTFAA